jgi:hypothetical protein
MTLHLAALPRPVRRLADFFNGIGEEATWRLTVLAQLQPPDYILSEPQGGAASRIRSIND